MPETVTDRSTYRPTDFESYQPDSCHADRETDVEQPSSGTTAGGARLEASSSLECRAPVESSSAGSAELTTRYLKARGTARSALPSGQGTDNNQARTSNRTTAPAPYAAAGLTSSGDAAFAGVAAMKGRDPGDGTEVELASVSGQLGAQNEAQAGLARIGVALGGPARGQLDVLTARVHAGIHNDDGSVGANVGAMATAASAEGSVSYHGFSLDLGVGVGAGLSIGSGLRDADQDGNPEACFRLAGGVLGKGTLGVCVEMPGRETSPEE
jgi:hypothetical protein